MRVSRLKTNLILWAFVLTFFSITITARADDDDEPDDYDVKARVVRISLMAGEVNLKRNGNQDFEPARLNYPLVEGDIVATDNNSRLEIQVDARNFIRLAANSTLRIVTLRDEGIALSVVEGTVTVRLAKFDRKTEYFEVDAPQTTLAAEKEGLYRVDVPREGRVRLTVRDGGSARIYSDTSGFALRDGRSAELVVNGDNSGDWEFLAAAPRDAIDHWINEREQHLAQKLKSDVKYFDEYVWGAEDLDAYGDWSYTGDYGWTWRPRSNTTSVFSDWAPYRYGHWTWCPPYGWTWVGYEPWGWAPYHYGRWVYYNNYWVWCPRSKFYGNRSWWRPALVAFVVDISFGNDVCWYPLSYYQRDPHSRRYRRDHDGRDGRDRRHDRPGSGDVGGRRGRHDDGPWRGVTRLPRGDWGHPDRRGRSVDEPVARRVIERDPQTGELPGRGRLAGNLPSGRGREGGEGGNDSGRPRRFPVRNIPDRPTGAAERRPGAPLDEDLRRSRVFRGREPRQDPSQPTNTAATPGTETRSTGAVARPEPAAADPNQPRPEMPGTTEQPREGRAGRTGRPNTPEGGGRRGPNQGGNERAPRNAPDAGNPTEPRTEQPAAAPEPRRETPSQPVRPRLEPRSEPSDSQPQPVVEPRSEAPSERRPEGRPTRSDSPRLEPRSEPRNETPRTESPRNESPRSEPRPEPRPESPRSESRPSRPESPRSESPRSESPRSESPRSESPRSESPRSEAPRSEPPRSESPKSESPKSESPRSESPRSAPDRPSKPDRPSDN
jgi:hypothetical protein